MNKKIEFGREVIVSEDVKYIGEEEDPKDNLGFQIWEKYFKEVYTNKDELAKIILQFLEYANESKTLPFYLMLNTYDERNENFIKDWVNNIWSKV